MIDLLASDELQPLGQGESVDQADARQPVLVGIDGSQASINAAKWATAEAATRGVLLRLVHVVRGIDSLEQHIERGQAALSRAQWAVSDPERPVRVETALLHGDPEQVLIDESRGAAMVCVGAAAAPEGEARPLGPVAAALAQHAKCPVAVIRTDPYWGPADKGVILVVLDDEPDNDEVVHQAMREGRLRKTTVRQIDQRRDSWVRRFPDVHVETVSGGTSVRYSDNHSDAIQLAVVGQRDAAKVAGLSALNGHPIPGYPDCSVLFVRQ